MQDEIKIYDAPVEGTEAVFRFFKMETVYDIRGGVPDEPHRHNYYTLIMVKQATGDHFVDFKHYSLAPNQIYFVSPGQVHQVIETSRPEGYGMIFTEEFLVRNRISNHFIEDLNLFKQFGETPPLVLSDSKFEELFGWLQKLEEYYLSEKTFKSDAIGAYLKLFLIACFEQSDAEQSNPQTKQHGVTLLKDFKNLLNEMYRETHSSKDFAEKLNISPDHLNKSIKLLTGKTAKELIQSKVSTEAKRLLYFSDLSNKEIAFQLGFREPSHFSTFFKKCTGQSPSEYRKKQ